jgi:hypothetical protein
MKAITLIFIVLALILAPVYIPQIIQATIAPTATLPASVVVWATPTAEAPTAVPTAVPAAVPTVAPTEAPNANCNPDDLLKLMDFYDLQNSRYANIISRLTAENSKRLSTEATDLVGEVDMYEPPACAEEAHERFYNYLSMGAYALHQIKDGKPQGEIDFTILLISEYSDLFLAELAKLK